MSEAWNEVDGERQPLTGRIRMENLANHNLRNERVHAALEIIRPQAEHDDMTFDALSHTYSFCKISDRRRSFVRLVIQEIQSRHPARVLDIGCGRGISAGRNAGEYLDAIRFHADEMVGVEPDEDITPRPGIFDDIQHAPMERAYLPANSIDVAYSFMVMEHVANPHAFMGAVYRCLKPGGVYVFITPNARHIFGAVTSLTHMLKVDELLLRLIARQSTENYHYPVQYRFNRPTQIDRCAMTVGFERPQYAYTESGRGLNSYFVGPMRLALHALRLKRRWIHNPRCLLNLMCRLRKPQ